MKSLRSGRGRACPGKPRPARARGRDRAHRRTTSLNFSHENGKYERSSYDYVLRLIFEYQYIVNAIRWLLFGP